MFNYTQLDLIVLGTGGSLVLLTVLLTGFLVYSHLSYYTAPQAQTYIIRIALMAPIYSINSMLSLCFHDYSLYFDVLRDCYEAFVLYQFFALLLYYFNIEATDYFPSNGDDKRLVELISSSLSDHESLNNDDRTEFVIEEPVIVDTTIHYLSQIGLAKFPIPCCCIAPSVPGNRLFNCIRLCVYQYMVVKPLLSVIAMTLHLLDLYHPGSFDWRYGYLWIMIAMNLSVIVALYYLIIFYNLTHHIIKSHRPLSKLLSIKAVLFFLFWQTILIEFLVYMSWIPPHCFDILGGLTSASINNLLIVVEMFILAISNFFIFSNREYKMSFLYTTLDPNADPDEIEMTGKKNHTTKRLKNMVNDVLNPMDLIKDGSQIIRGKDTKVL